MSQTASRVPKPPRRQNESTETESVRTVNVRAPPSSVAAAPHNGEKEEDKKKVGVAGWREKMASKGAEMAANAMAGAATLNAAVAAGGDMVRNRLAENSSDDDDDVESSDEETEDIWNSATDSAASTAPSATAISIRNQPAVDFLKMEEEERIKGELKDAKNLRKKLRKIKKWMKKSVKSVRTFSETNETAIATLHAATDENCTDPTIIELTAAAEKRIQDVKASNALSNFGTHITDQILEQIKPINDHAKMISVTGKERRAARDRRIRLALEEVDVSNEEAYNKSAELVRDFEEKDRTYKDEFINFREHNSSQLGLMLRCYLLETASYLETVAKAMREAAGGAANNYYLSNDCCTKFKDFKVDSKFLSPIPPLFSNISPSRDVEDRLTAKPQSSKAPESLAGIPMTDAPDTAEGQGGYGASAYTRSKDNTRVRRSIDNFLLTGQLPSSEASRMSPRPPVGRSPNADGPQARRDDALPLSENSRAQPTSAFETSSTTKSLMDYIHSLADEYGIEPEFSVKRTPELRSVEGRRGQHNGNVNDVVNGGEDDGTHDSRPPSVVPRPKSATPDGSLILPSLRGSGRLPAPTPVPVVRMQDYK